MTPDNRAPAGAQEPPKAYGGSYVDKLGNRWLVCCDNPVESGHMAGCRCAPQPQPDRASDGARDRPTLADEGRALVDDALLSRLVTFLAVVGASTPDDHPWVTESRALADAVSAARRESRRLYTQEEYDAALSARAG